MFCVFVSGVDFKISRFEKTRVFPVCGQSAEAGKQLES
jgi:hypothetical protein